jgi:hypothetical protein
LVLRVRPDGFEVNAKGWKLRAVELQKELLLMLSGHLKTRNDRLAEIGALESIPAYRTCYETTSAEWELRGAEMLREHIVSLDSIST